MKGVLVVVVHPPTFPSTKGSQYTMAVFGRAGTYGRSRKRQHASPLARVSQEVRQLRHYGRDPQHCCLTSPATIIDQGYLICLGFEDNIVSLGLGDVVGPHGDVSRRASHSVCAVW